MGDIARASLYLLADMFLLLTILLSTAHAAPTADCGADLAPIAWSALPAIADHELPANFLTALERHPLTKLARERHGRGESLFFDFSMTVRQQKDGWGIQAHFLRLMLSAWFPAAVFTDAEATGRTRVNVLIIDSRLSFGAEDHEIEMDNLKLANPGFDVPARDRLRALMNLPADARVASFYASWTHERQIGEFINDLIAADLADLVILSTQTQLDYVWERLVSATPFATFTADEWHLRRSPTKSRAIIYNTTRGRMPYVHAASDYAVVLGAANAAEALHRGLPTYVTRRLQPTGHHPRWDNWILDLTSVGGAHAFVTSNGLTTLIRETAHEPPRGPLFENEKLLGRLLSQLLILIERQRP